MGKPQTKIQDDREHANAAKIGKNADAAASSTIDQGDLGAAAVKAAEEKARPTPKVDPKEEVMDEENYNKLSPLSKAAYKGKVRKATPRPTPNVDQLKALMGS